MELVTFNSKDPNPLEKDLKKEPEENDLTDNNPFVPKFSFHDTRTFFPIEKPKKHTPFAIETIKNDITGSYDMHTKITGGDKVDFGKKSSVVITRNGDLINAFSLEFYLPVLPKEFHYRNNLGYHLLKEISIEVGGCKWDTMTGEFMLIYQVLNNSPGNITKVTNNINRGSLAKLQESSSLFVSDDVETLKRWSHYGNSTLDGEPVIHLIVPIPKWFEHVSFPLIKVQYNEIKVTFEVSELDDLIISDNNYDVKSNLISIDNDSGITWNETQEVVNSAKDINQRFQKPEVYINQSFKIKQCKALIDYVYLDTVERRKTAQEPCKYLWLQTQFHGTETMISRSINSSHKSSVRIRLNFMHSVRYLLFTFKRKGSKELGLSYRPNSSEKVPVECFEKMLILLNGTERMEAMGPLYYREYQGQKYVGKTLPQGVYMFSHALKPFDYDPSGSCNYSRLDNIKLIIDFPGKLPNGEPFPEMDLNVYAVSNNFAGGDGSFISLAF